jgi:uncharacterized membrane protein
MAETNPNTRLEAFSDGVFAIALTLLIIEIKIPATASVHSASELWQAIGSIFPSLFAFILSFTIILITWVNHHTAMKLVDKSCATFMYANGFLLLTVVIIPFTTSLLGEYLLTDAAGPAVVLYNAVFAVQAIGWLLMSSASLKNDLGKSEKAIQSIRDNHKYGYYALALYSLLSVTAIWFPLAIAIATTVIWTFWLAWGLKIREA